MRSNTKVKTKPVFTHNGAKAANISLERQLERSVMSCMLFEGTFYEDGKDVASRILDLANKVSAKKVAELAVKARSEGNLRHVPLILALALAKKRYEGTADMIEQVIQRPDEMGELLALYWKEDKNQSITAQMKKGLARAFEKFNEYSLSKYRGLDREVSLRDVMFLVHPNPPTKELAKVYKKLANNTLEAAETWEKKASAGEDQKKVFTNLIKNEKLGALAMLRNLRNMKEAGVATSVIKKGLANMNIERVLPFRFITAARYAPEFEPELEEAMLKCLDLEEKLEGDTYFLVDVSGSMTAKVSGKSEISRMDAACGIAMLLREKCKSVKIYTFSTSSHLVPSRRGFPLRDAITSAPNYGGGTNLGSALRQIPKDYDRLIVITDEQSSDRVPNPQGLGYCINVASYANGVGYGEWVHVDGFSEQVVHFIESYEDILND
jgi:60 kDa SS-A/Ro ribonucleoprotein